MRRNLAGAFQAVRAIRGASAWFTMSGIHNSSLPAKSLPRFPSSSNLYAGLVVRSVQVEVCALSSTARQCLQVESLRYGVARGAFAQVRSDSAVRIREVPQAETALDVAQLGLRVHVGGEALSRPRAASGLVAVAAAVPAWHTAASTADRALADHRTIDIAVTRMPTG